MRGKIATAALGPTLAAATVAGRAHAATIKTVALQNDPSPRAPYLQACSGNLDRIALAGDVVPGSSPVATFRGLGQPSTIPRVKVAFLGRIRRGVPPMLHGVFVFE